jgi:hypothetical protein
MIKEVDSFSGFTGHWLEDNAVDACVDAMEKQKLHVCAKNGDGFYLWEKCFMAPLQWQRVYKIMRQQGIRTSVLWSFHSFAYHSPLLADLDCMWEDLDVIQAGMNEQLYYDILWVSPELRRRQGWRNGLRRAWLAAVVFAG